MNENINTMMEWLINNNSKTSYVYFKNNSGNRSVYSSKKINKNSKVISIPLKCLIHEGLAQNTKIGMDFLRANHSDCTNIKLTLIVIYMLVTMKEKGFYKPYYNILPNKLDNFPIFWPTTTLKILKGSHILNDIIDRKKNYINDYNIVCRTSELFKKSFTFNDFVTIRTLVGSRNFGINVNSIDRSAMVPLADMLNHDVPPNVTWNFNNITNCFEMISNKTINKDEEITDSYGNKCNSKLLLFYGFILDNNKDNNIKIEIKNNSLSYSGLLKKNISDFNFKTLISFLRSIVCKKNNLTFTNYKDPINLDIELQVLNILKNHMHEKLKLYLDENQLSKKLKQTKKTNERIAIKFILGEIDIINFYIKMTNTSINFLKNNIYPDTDEYNDYINQLNFQTGAQTL